MLFSKWLDLWPISAPELDWYIIGCWESSDLTYSANDDKGLILA